MPCVAAGAGLDWRTIATYEAGDCRDFRYNVINALATFYEVTIEDIIEPVPLELLPARSKPAEKTFRSVKGP